jgi:putative glycosyltransferase (TIGR04348 family)
VNITIVTPAPRGTRSGNRVTAQRWARLLRDLGHRVRVVVPTRAAPPGDLVVALHAGKSAATVRAVRRERPEVPVVVALTGTDVYGDLRRGGGTRRTLDLADRLVVLQPRALEELPAVHRRRARVIYQSVALVEPVARPARHAFEVCVVGHLRPVKDPFRTALAARAVPRDCRLRVLQIGGALSPAMERRAHAEQARNPRYRWLGELSRGRALRRMRSGRLLVLSSRAEGGANVVSEAVVAGVPILASRIPGTVGLLGEGYPGYFPVGDTASLTRLLVRSESDPRYLDRLRRHLRRLAPRFSPERERRSWQRLLAGLRAGSVPT